jgi:hydrogenase expression/formation protein HypC
MCLGIPGRIVSLDDKVRKLATVEVAGIRRQINIACIVDDAHPPESAVGQWVLVHVGFAMSRIDEGEAMTTLRILAELGEAQEQIAAMSRPVGASL